MRRKSVFSLLLLGACSGVPSAAPEVPACGWMRAPAAGPLAAEVAAASAPLDIAELRVREARLTGDPGFYTLADQAVSCALARDPADLLARRAQAHVWLQFHRFAQVEALAQALVAEAGGAADWMLLSDAQMEQGKLDLAEASLQKALDLKPSLALLDRAAWLVWQRGDLERAIELERQAMVMGDPADAEPMAWAATRFAAYVALAGHPSDALDQALQLVPAYRPALLLRGRLRAAAGEPGAAEDLRAAGQTVAAVTALAELDPSVDVAAVGDQDPRGFAVWLADHGDPARATRLLEEELQQRQDAATRVAHAYAVHRAGGDGRAEARAAVATGIADPEVLVRAAVVLADPELARRALQRPAGLLPSWRRLAESVAGPRTL